MKVFKPTLIAAAVAAVVSPLTAQAADTLFDNFTSLTSSAGPIPVGGAGEATPITLSNPGFTQVTIADRTTQNTLVSGSNSGNWDMITANETGPNAGRYLFMPFETNTGGVQRIDLQDPNYNTRTTTIVAPGTSSFVSGDASRWTPWGSYLTAEESWSNTAGNTKGRLFEVTNPTTATASGGTMVQRSIIPHVSHEGLAFDSNNSLYFIDELNGGAIFKYSSNAVVNGVLTDFNLDTVIDGNDFFAAGQTFAMKVGAGSQSEGNNGPAITGAFTWEAITNTSGAALNEVSMLASDGNINGRASATAVGATGYNRPEDLEIQNLGGNQLIYFATTDSDNNGIEADGRSRVYNFNVATNTVSLFADTNTIDLATGLAVGSGLHNADNVAIDAEGNIYLIEDRNGGVDDDIWFAKDINKDGDLLDTGEGLARWASNGTQGSEFTGLYFDKFNPNVAYVNIQHPSSGNDRTMMITATPAAVPVPGAVWLFGSALLGFMGVSRRKA